MSAEAELPGTADIEARPRVEIVYGRDHLAEAEMFVLPIGPRVAIAASAGMDTTHKVDGNEDVIAYVSCGEAEAAIVADGHFGRRAAEIAVETSIRELTRGSLEFAHPENAISLVLAQALEDIAAELSPDFSALETSPETTLLVYLRDQRGTYIASVGDSLCLARAPGHGIRMLAPLQRSWLGVGCALRSRCPDREGVRRAAKELGIGFWKRGRAERACAMRAPLSEHFRDTLGTGDAASTFVVSTDGLAEGSEDAAQQIDFSLMKGEGKSAEEVAREILAAAIARGCGDNVGFVLLLPRGTEARA